ncbi:hypothetical protein D3C78_1255180 [compost metagenome]
MSASDPFAQRWLRCEPENPVRLNNALKAHAGACHHRRPESCDSLALSDSQRLYCLILDCGPHLCIGTAGGYLATASYCSKTPSLLTAFNGIYSRRNCYKAYSFAHLSTIFIKMPATIHQNPDAHRLNLEALRLLAGGIPDG